MVRKITAPPGAEPQETFSVVGSEGAGEPAGPATPLAALADQIEQEHAQAVTDADVAGIPEGGEPVKPTMTNAVAVAHMFRAVRATVCLVAGLEAPRRTLTDEKTDKLGEIWGGVLDAYGINLADRAGKHFVIIAAGMQSVDLLEETFIETRKEIIEKDSKRPQQLPAPAPGTVITARPTGPAAAGYVEGAVKPAFPT